MIASANAERDVRPPSLQAVPILPAPRSKPLPKRGQAAPVDLRSPQLCINPELSPHNEGILAGVGYGEGDTATFRTEGVVQ